MKRFVLAAAAFGLLAVPVAYAVETDVVLSGAFAASVSYYKPDSGDGDFALKNNASQVGIFASAQEQGYRGFVNYERGFDRYSPTSTNTDDRDFVREFFGGISHATYGTLSLGRQSTAYKLSGRRLDPFYDTSLSGFNGQFSNEGASFGLSNITNGFTSNTLAYTSPVIYQGLSANAAYFFRDGNSDSNDYAVGGSYENVEYDLTAGIQYVHSDGPVVSGFPPPGGNAARAHAGYGGFANWNFGGSFEYVDVDGASSARKYFFASATYQLLPDLKLAAVFGDTQDTPFDGQGVTVGAFYTFFKDLTAYSGVRYATLETTNSFTVATGLSYTFDVDLK